jgi:exosome complex component RRP41
VIITSVFPRSEINISVQIIQSDGSAFIILLFNFLLGMRSCAINAISLALSDAGIPMNDLICSCEAGYLDNSPLIGIPRSFFHFILDLNFTEECGGGPEVPIALFPRTKNVSLLQMDSRLSIDLLRQVLLFFLINIPT